MDHFGARNQGSYRRKELPARREGEGLGMRARTVFKESRNSVGPREGYIKSMLKELGSQERFRLFWGRL